MNAVVISNLKSLFNVIELQYSVSSFIQKYKKVEINDKVILYMLRKVYELVNFIFHDSNEILCDNIAVCASMEFRNFVWEALHKVNNHIIIS